MRGDVRLLGRTGTKTLAWLGVGRLQVLEVRRLIIRCRATRCAVVEARGLADLGQVRNGHLILSTSNDTFWNLSRMHFPSFKSRKCSENQPVLEFVCPKARPEKTLVGQKENTCINKLNIRRGSVHLAAMASVDLKVVLLGMHALRGWKGDELAQIPHELLL